MRRLGLCGAAGIPIKQPAVAEWDGLPSALGPQVAVTRDCYGCEVTVRIVG